MLDYGLRRSKDLIRQSLIDVRALSLETQTSVVDDALAYFGRQNDHDAVLDKLEDRFGYGVRKDEEGGFETYAREGIIFKIQQGEYETLTGGIGPRIVSATANLFTQKTQAWDWVKGEDSEGNPIPADDVAEKIQQLRHDGGFFNEIIKADTISCSVESGPMLTSWQGGGLRYNAFSPACLYAIFQDEILDDGEPRGVDYTDIEDATVVIIQLARSTDGRIANASDNAYMAFFGRSDQYPYGRFVQYVANNYYDIPEVGEYGAVDYPGPGPKGEGNPLSILATQVSRYVPEYPVIILNGGITITDDTLVPVTTSLWENCVELDVGLSRLLKDVLNAARGKDVVTSDSGEPLPVSLEAFVSLHNTQSLQVLGRDASHSQVALEVLKDMSRSIAEGYNVPGYQVFQSSDTFPEAGVALHIRTRPLIDFREKRIKKNEVMIARQFEIERSLHEFHSGEPAIPDDVKQVWGPGRYIVPESEAEKAERLQKAQKARYISYVRAVRDYHDFPTDKDAEAYIELMEQQDSKHPAPGAGRLAEPVGLTAEDEL